MISNKSRVVLDKLIKEGSLPCKGMFNVTDDLINKTFCKWNEVYHPKYDKKLSSSAIRYGKKIAGLNLMKLNLEREEVEIVTKKKSTKLKIKCGVVYVITNEAFPGYFKVGMTTDLDARLKNYQTYDPLKRYKVEHYSFVTNRRDIEKELLDKYRVDLSTGEWVSNENVKKAIVSL